jgi:hypothetical protein
MKEQRAESKIRKQTADRGGDALVLLPRPFLHALSLKQLDVLEDAGAHIHALLEPFVGQCYTYLSQIQIVVKHKCL